jgi:hypothetical protein
VWSTKLSAKIGTGSNLHIAIRQEIFILMKNNVTHVSKKFTMLPIPAAAKQLFFLHVHVPGS